MEPKGGRNQNHDVLKNILNDCYLLLGTPLVFCVQHTGISTALLLSSGV